MLPYPRVVLFPVNFDDGVREIKLPVVGKQADDDCTSQM